MVLENKKALVTGASRGIGRAIGDLFLAEGAEVWGLSAGKPEDLAARIDRAGGMLHWLQADLAGLDTLEGIIEGALKEAGGFDILVNNAGITKDNLAFRMTLDDFRRVLDVNLSAAFVLSRVVGRDMIRRRSGSIINMSSVVGIHGNGGQANYAASKAGLIGLTKSLARETASRNVRVNAVAPGFVDTGMTAGLPDKVKETMLEQIPLKRMGTPGDIAAAVLFLASDASAYITGQVLAVDGGMFM
ncbi:MAG: 3-oxoacyl-[acyl-carrier-protein] reductase [Treponema sp.]|jgi:3-oxoacyl-[acyl-carrier protein] reductase|nr:3-oxoacyl-[acyl-carrier-protein] reductase [Treponema sp.]